MNETIDRHAPIGFYNLAEDFYKAAILCAAAREEGTVQFKFSHVPYYLHTHSIELALKAYLRSRNITEAELKKILPSWICRYPRQMREAGAEIPQAEAHAGAGALRE